MKRSILLLAVVLSLFIPARAAAAPPAQDEGAQPALYTPEQIKLKFNVDVSDGNYSLVVLSILEWMGSTSNEEEYSIDVIIGSVKEMALRLPEPARGMVNLIVADFYCNYWKANRWQIGGRTSAPDAEGGIASWDLQRLFREALKYYELAMADGEALKNTPLGDYALVLSPYPYDMIGYTRHTADKTSYYNTFLGRFEYLSDYYASFFPTLYDFITYNAIYAFSGELSAAIPQQAFVIDSPGYLADVETFVNLDIARPEDPSAEYEVLRHYQKLLSFRLDEYAKERTGANLLPLIFLDVERLDYVRKKGVYADADRLYEDALLKLGDDYRQSPESAYALYKLAQLYETQAKKWSDGKSNDALRYKYVEARDLCLQAIERWPEFAKYPQDLADRITMPEINVEIEKELYPSVPFLVKANYRNLDRIYIRIYEFDDGQNPLSVNSRLFSNRPSVREEKIELTHRDDLQPYSVQFAMEGLPQGRYLLFVSEVPIEEIDPSVNDRLLAKTSFRVSSLMGVFRGGDNEIFGIPGDERDMAWQFCTVERRTGEPIGGAKVECYVSDVDLPRNRKGEYPEKLLGTYTTDSKGIVNIPVADELWRWKPRRIVVTAEDGRRLEMNEDMYASFWRDEPDDEPLAVFFTDRIIYRPGQTVYYKALLMQADEDGRNHLLPDHEMEVEFYDVNYNLISSQILKTNDFGSVQGSFAIPQGLLNGWMEIESEYGDTRIKVEEYKRPTFEVKLDPVKENIRLGQAVTVTGAASALAGYVVDNSVVKYNVVRDSNYGFMRGSSKHYAPRQVVSGEMLADVDGRFEISFDAVADDIQHRDLVFEYKVSVDVTDPNGETRSATMTVRVSDKPLLLHVNLPNVLNDRKSLGFEIAATNLNRQAVVADVSVAVTALEGPGRILRDRLWSKPDETLMAKDRFLKLFPNDVYDEEDDPATYAPLRVVHTAQLTTTAEPKAARLDLGSLARQPAGWYKIDLVARDADGIEAKIVRYVRLRGSVSGKKPSPIMNMDEWMTKVKVSGNPGENAVFLVGAPVKNSLVHYDVFSGGRIVSSHTAKVGPVPREITLPIKSEYNGDISVVFMMVCNGRLYTNSSSVEVLSENMELDVSFTTFRDQLLPGEHEKWTLTVSNANGEKEMAEMVATLYDASLDAFVNNRWPDGRDFRPQYRTAISRWQSGSNSQTATSTYVYNRPQKMLLFSMPVFVVKMLYGRLLSNDGRANGGSAGKNIYTENLLKTLKLIDPSIKLYGPKYSGSGDPNTVDEVVVTGFHSLPRVMMSGAVSTISLSDTLTEGVVSNNDSDGSIAGIIGAAQAHEEIATRRNFNETAFFYPQLRTDENGTIAIEFTIPEALTRWKMLGFAHTKDLRMGSVENTLVTRKLVAVSANAPRFFREGDVVEFAAKVNNITGDDLAGQTMLRVYDAATMQPLEGVLRSPAALDFEVAAGQSRGMSWTLAIPEGVSAITYRLTAKAGQHTDGEERTVPVMTNSILVTETMPFHVRGGETKEVVFERMRDKAEEVQRNHGLTLEFTSNPAWYAVLAMPYLMEYPYECAEQVFSRFYANSLSASIVDGTPRIKAIFEQWRDLPDGQNALMSNLEKNQELKQVLLEETPWVMQAQNESERKKRLGMLFDLNTMGAQQRIAFDKLVNAQNGDGGFPWFSGLPACRYITQHIVAGMCKLTALKALPENFAQQSQTMLDKAFAYLDSDLVRDYEELKRRGDLDPNISYVQMHYLYAASFLSRKPEDAEAREAFDFYYGQARKYWYSLNIYGQGLAALVFNRYGDGELARKVVASLKAKARTTDDMGMFWRENRAGYFWHEAPIETQALMVEVFNEVVDDQKSVGEIKIWLLGNKQTNDWTTTKATADACYALLVTGGSLLDESRTLDIKVDGRPLADVAQGGIRPEVGTGYVKTSWSSGDITPGMGVLEVANPNSKGIAWGGMYWQYFEHVDKVTNTETDLGMDKEVFIKKNTSRGPELVKVTEGTAVKVGDLLTVRLVLRVHRDYEYVHIKDMRASAFEPIKTLSGYRYQDGLWYYENIKDASTNFFITLLRSGTYVFEYDLRVSHAGEFSNGITTFQCMYAPEYSAHSAGMRIKVE